MSNKGKYKIPRAHVLWPILWRSIVFIGIIILIFSVLNILAGYIRDFRSEADRYLKVDLPFGVMVLIDEFINP